MHAVLFLLLGLSLQPPRELICQVRVTNPLTLFGRGCAGMRGGRAEAKVPLWLEVRRPVRR
ncbi:hypothetical protein [Paenibacillus ginsengarvi]|uniref:hypothetical protein n=1 Tax=Paenibacillus ginsengarvi TaxID=400777 RepID=UPI0011C43718|nr:hypothetical protein [Paenibacillus ginsengarvi]